MNRILKKYKLVLIILLAITIILLASSLPVKQVNSTKVDKNKIEDQMSPEEISASIKINKGNAQYATDPSKEYFVIENIGSRSIDISGWKIANSNTETPKGYRSIFKTFSYSTPSLPYGQSPDQNIILESGDRAIVTTGKTPAQEKYFKESNCEPLPSDTSYIFTPSLVQKCTCAKNTKEIANYSACISSVVDSSYRETWRVFLGKETEYWSENEEEITLYDTVGNMIKSIQY